MYFNVLSRAQGGAGGYGNGGSAGASGGVGSAQVNVTGGPRLGAGGAHGGQIGARK